MEISRPLQNLIKQAQSISTSAGVRYFKINATLITPTEHIPVYLVQSYSVNAMFGADRSDDIRLTCEIQPGVYLKKVLPFRDDLKLQMLEREGIKQISRMYRCIPLSTSDPEKTGNSTTTGNLEGMDNLNLITVNLQLQELGFAYLRNSFVGDSVFLMSKTANALKHSLITEGERLDLTDADAWRGIDMPEDGDNSKVYKHIEIPDGTRLMDLPLYLQNDPKYGIYSKGIGCYFRKGMFYVFPLFKMGRYETANKVLDIFRMPTDAVPTLEVSYYSNNKTITVLSTGEAKHDSKIDIVKQNKGVGKRIISPDAISGQAGYYYANGNAITTRSDSISEFQTSKRASGEEISVFDRNPAENICKPLSENAMNDGDIMVVPWDSSNAALLSPGMPCMYYYTQENKTLIKREGVVLGVVSQYVKNDASINSTFRESSQLFLFLSNEAIVVE